MPVLRRLRVDVVRVTCGVSVVGTIAGLAAEAAAGDLCSVEEGGAFANLTVGGGRERRAASDAPAAALLSAEIQTTASSGVLAFEM